MEASKDLAMACRLDYDDQANEWLKEVTPKVKSKKKAVAVRAGASCPAIWMRKHRFGWGCSFMLAHNSILKQHSHCGTNNLSEKSNVIFLFGGYSDVGMLQL